MEMEQHVKVVAVLRIGLSVLWLLIAALMFVLIVGGGWISQDPDAMRITWIVGTAIAGFLAVLSVPGILAGIGLLKHWSWARWLTLILAVLDLTMVPVGTLFGIYTIWVMLQDGTEQLFS